MPRALVVSLLLALAGPAPAAGDRAAIAQAVAAPDRSAADRERDAAEKPVEVLGFFGVQPGMQIADVMSGGGYYSEILARTVGPTGTVIAQNNAPYVAYAGKEANRRFAGGRLANVRRVNSELEDMKLGEGTLDLILLVMAYHDAYWIGEDWPTVDTDKFMAQLYAALKPGGIVAVVDHIAPAGSGITLIDKLHRIDPEFVRAEFQRFGFVFDGESDLLRNPADEHTKEVFDESIRRKTDRFVYRFRKQDQRVQGFSRLMQN
ncbi:MAG: class I SAM-dependent methyltransferase [Gammaproteobacteria bacterium]|nr:class I SAM-dependent methyltransferase [Gammaproteobacteria bacterium]